MWMKISRGIGSHESAKYIFWFICFNLWESSSCRSLFVEYLQTSNKEIKMSIAEQIEEFMLSPLILFVSEIY